MGLVSTKQPSQSSPHLHTDLQMSSGPTTIVSEQVQTMFRDTAPFITTTQHNMLINVEFTQVGVRKMDPKGSATHAPSAPNTEVQTRAPVSALMQACMGHKLRHPDSQLVSLNLCSSFSSIVASYWIRLSP